MIFHETKLAGAFVVAFFSWLLGANPDTVLVGLGIALVIVFVWTVLSSRSAERQMRRGFE